MVLEPPQLPLDPLADFLLGLRAEVWQSLKLQRGPNQFIRVEFRRVGREPTGLEPLPSLPQRGLHVLAPMEGPGGPEQEDPPAHLLQQVPEELKDPIPVKVLVHLTDPKVELPLHSHRREPGELHPLPLVDLDIGPPPFHPPSRSYLGPRLNEALVQEQEGGPGATSLPADLQPLGLLPVPYVRLVPLQRRGDRDLGRHA